MGQMGNALHLQVVDRHTLQHFEKHFISPEISRRHDIAIRQSDLARFVSNEIVPRLMRLHTEVVPDAPPVESLIDALRPSSAEIDALAHIVLGDDLEAAATYVTIMRDRGLSMETLYIELLEPTARHLGEMWDNDECDFIDVTIGVGRLQKLLAIFNETYALPELGTRRRVLMATTPGNQHSFGASMIERLLSAAGWQVDAEYSGNADDIVNAVSHHWFAVIGLTAGSDRQLEALKSIIVEIRKESQNEAIGIMVGGPMFTENPAMASAMGADATAPNAPTAVLAAQKLFDLAVPNWR
ncbi:B12-binding domain-containing protein [Sphingorhabdus sp.]|uniref:cobalamin B12-binding domain-containing protein n=1 Tax=Sphingorhabdus sp. TaxID=1902408 RepID=UPI00359480DE